MHFKEKKEENSFIILGVDPGYERCGFALIEKKRGEKKETLLHSECFTTKKEEDFSSRLLSVSRRFETLILSFSPRICSLEKVYFTNNQKTALRVSEVRGAFLYIAGNTGTLIKEYTPNEIKVAIAGNGNAHKKDIMSMIPHLITLPHPILYDDEYDAIATALTASAILRF